MKITSINPLQSQVDTLDNAVPSDSTEDAVEPLDDKTKKLHEEFLQRIVLCKAYRRKLVANWTVNTDYRRGKPFTSQTDEDQIAVPLDWTYTKAKQAALFSQIPQVRIVHSPETLPKSLPWVPVFERVLNDKLIESGIESVMDECLPDCINAAGIGVAMVSYEAITEDKEVPSIDMSQLPPQLQAEAMQKGTLGGKPIPKETVPFPVDKKYQIERISPADFLWPINFTGSDFNKAPWIGRSGRLPWAEAQRQFKLDNKQKETILGEDKTIMDKLTHDVEKDRISADDMVGFDEIFYRTHQYDKSNSFSEIHHLVFIGSQEKPVVDEPWRGQKLDEEFLIGATKYPIQVLTLTYLTDEAIPPSDTAIARPQANEINKGRTQQIRQRERSLPVRWTDVNRIDPAVMQSLMRGTWQSFIPTQGAGDKVIGEVARASMPPESYAFDKVARRDFKEVYGIGTEEDELDEGKNDPNQNTSPFNSQTGRERAKVGSFFCGLAEVLGGLVCLYEDAQVFGEGFDPKFSRALKFSILTDSTVLLDAGQRLARLDQFIEKYGKTGYVDLEPCLQEVASLIGLDSSLVIHKPQPKGPAEPNISLRLTGVEDLLNPMSLAMLITSGQAPDEKAIEKAKQLIQQAVVMPQAPPGQETAPGMSPEGSPQPGQPLSPPQPGVPQGAPTPQTAPPEVGEAHPQWTQMPNPGKRTDGGQG